MDEILADKIKKFEQDLRDLAEDWQVAYLDDDDNLIAMRATAKQLGITAMLRAALTLLDGGAE